MLHTFKENNKKKLGKIKKKNVTYKLKLRNLNSCYYNIKFKICQNLINVNADL